MGYTEFTDRQGRSWRVWHTVPQFGLLAHRAPEWANGWLTFESGHEKRRLAPVPPGWDRLPPARLELLCRLAQPAAQSSQIHDCLGEEEREQ
jgi:hypothetical protein